MSFLPRISTDIDVLQESVVLVQLLRDPDLQINAFSCSQFTKLIYVFLIFGGKQTSYKDVFKRNSLYVCRKRSV